MLAGTSKQSCQSSKSNQMMIINDGDDDEDDDILGCYPNSTVADLFPKS